jgi:putative DNA primase/helicase
VYVLINIKDDNKEELLVFSRQRQPVDRKPDAEARTQAFEVFLRLSALQQIEAELDLLSSRPFLRFAPDAQTQFKEWRAQLELRLRADDDPESFESVIAKMRSLVPSLALLIHLAERPQGGAVSLSALQKAIRWAEYSEAHARRIYATTLSSETTAVLALVKKIQEGDLDLVFENYRRASGTDHTAFTARDVYKNHWKGLDRESTVKALDWLVNANWLWKQTIQTKGRPTAFYLVRPEMLN